ncbi:Translation initiation factor eIF-2B subunit gamma [Triticum urartu]|uniref:Translation initiation factor eIF2B subunit gamma n=1 Tax=Triticum urartu TaxID=4572 RepID=M7YXH2_TRIUA|nr:Translation initiation factor eIF-2B subunit gamma [Triticum urartu]
MDFQVVVLAGGISEKLSPLVSKDVPKALLPVANRPAISYVLDLLESSDLKDIIVHHITRLRSYKGKVFGEDVGWSGASSLLSLVSFSILIVSCEPTMIRVVAVTEDIGTAGALRAISKRLVANDVLVISGDLVTDVLPGAVAATHRRNGAAVTALLCSVPVSGPSDAASSGGKDKAKKPCRLNIVGLDITRQFLLHVVSGTDVEKDVRVYKRKIRAVGQVGPQCMLAEGSQLGDKCGVKRSVIGRHCRIGSNVKIVNSVVMNHVVIEDGCHIQGSVICNNVQLQERAVLKDCQVGAGYTVTTGSDHKSESLARK